MERGFKHFNKGRQGHARNVNPYQIYRERMKKWRLPFIAGISLLLIFGMVPGVGEDFKASVLHSEKENLSNGAQKVATENLEDAKKSLLVSVEEFRKTCERLALAECDEKNKKLAALISGIQYPETFFLMENSFEDVKHEFGPLISLASCRADLPPVLSQGNEVLKNLEKFSFADPLYEEGLLKVNEGVESLRNFLRECRKKWNENKDN